MAYADTPKGAGINNGYAFDAAKLQNNSETTKDKEKKTLDYLSISAPIAEARDNQELISAAKVQRKIGILQIFSVIFLYHVK